MEFETRAEVGDDSEGGKGAVEAYMRLDPLEALIGGRRWTWSSSEAQLIRSAVRRSHQMPQEEPWQAAPARRDHRRVRARTQAVDHVSDATRRCDSGRRGHGGPPYGARRRARTANERLDSTASVSPPGLSPSAIALVLRLQDPLRAGLTPGPTSCRPREWSGRSRRRWARAGVRPAPWPARCPRPPRRSAFRDRAELLTCSARSAAPGRCWPTGGGSLRSAGWTRRCGSRVRGAAPSPPRAALALLAREGIRDRVGSLALPVSGRQAAAGGCSRPTICEH